MIKTILTEANKFVNSSEFDDLVAKIAEDFSVADSDVSYLSSSISAVILGSISEGDLVNDILSTSEIRKDTAERIFSIVKQFIFRPFKERVAAIVKKNMEAGIQEPEIPPTEPMATYLAEGVKKDDILQSIENPPRTVIKRYVLEHEPIMDTNRLIDDRIDNTIKLEDHYAD